MGNATKRIRPLTDAELDQLPQLCPECAGPRTAGQDGSCPVQEGRRASAMPSVSWARSVTDYWGLCGVTISVEQQIVGYLTLAPAPMAPRTGRYANAHLSADVGVLLDVAVAEEHRGHGFGRQLVQGAAAEMAQRGVTALEALGSRPSPAVADGTERGIPLDFLLAVGFRVVAEHPVAPRVRMDLNTTVRWRPDLAAAWRRLTGLVSQPAPPQPAGFKQSRQAEPTPAPR